MPITYPRVFRAQRGGTVTITTPADYHYFTAHQSMQDWSEVEPTAAPTWTPPVVVEEPQTAREMLDAVGEKDGDARRARRRDLGRRAALKRWHP